MAWSECHENQALVGSGDGSIKLFDCNVGDFPVQTWKEHGREVFKVDWNGIMKENFCSSSWDGTIRVWSAQRPDSILTLPTHTCTYSAAYSPHDPFLISSVSSDSYLRLFDLRAPNSGSNHLSMKIPIHGAPPAGSAGAPPSPPAEALCHDWNKYRPTVVATGGVDRVIRTFDIRAPQNGALALMLGHDYAVRTLAWSPHFHDVLLSGGYDMTSRVWSDGSLGGDDDLMRSGPAGPMVGRELGRMTNHTEFVTGVDWCLFGTQGWCASVGWDQSLYVWDAGMMIAKR